MVATKKAEKTEKVEKIEKPKAEAIDVEKLPMLNVGMVGHIDHGKTTLLSKLTGKWTDTHSEELKRGITIKLGYADLIIKDRSGKPLQYVTFVDAPGHEMLMATMMSGAAMMDAAILLVAANEGIKPQTREHLMALEAKNIKNIIIVQNKIDLLSKEKVLESYKEIKAFVKGTIAENSPVIPCSAQQNINLDKIIEELGKIEIPERDSKSAPVFVIARSFDINKPGADISEMKGGVFGGTLKRGKLRVGDEIEIKPGLLIKKAGQVSYEKIKTRIVSLVRGNYKIQEAGPGGSLAIETELDPSITKADSLSGNVIGAVNQLPQIQSRVKIKFSIFNEVFIEGGKEKILPLKTMEMIMLSVNTTITVGSVVKLDQEKKEAELSLKIPVVEFKGEKVGMARLINNHWRLIGFGDVV